MLKIDVEPITLKLLNKQTAHSAYIKHTQEEANFLRDLVEHELLTNIGKTFPSVNNTDEKLVAVTPKNKDKRVRFTEPVTTSGNTITKTTSPSNLVSNKPMLSSTGVKPSASASGSQYSGNTKKDKNRQTPSSTQKNKTAEITTTTEVPLRKPTALENETPKPVVTLVYSRKPRKSKTNVPVSKSKIRNVTIARVFYVEGLGHNLFSVGQFCDSNLEVAFRQHACFIRNLEDNGTEFVNQTLREYYEKFDISHETSVARSPQQNGVVERRNCTLIEAASIMLINAKAPLFLWAKVVATTCYTQNSSTVRLRHDKTPYELLHDKPPDLSFFNVFGALYYLTNDSENLGKLQPKADIGIFIGYAPTKKAF
ncbi:retrovirus-related pol polyprotein from transposon TNT 1-94 [Tanacetum coccineum]